MSNELFEITYDDPVFTLSNMISLINKLIPYHFPTTKVGMTIYTCKSGFKGTNHNITKDNIVINRNNRTVNIVPLQKHGTTTMTNTVNTCKSN